MSHEVVTFACACSTMLLYLYSGWAETRSTRTLFTDQNELVLSMPQTSYCTHNVDEFVKNYVFVNLLHE